MPLFPAPNPHLPAACSFLPPSSLLPTTEKTPLPFLHLPFHTLVKAGLREVRSVSGDWDTCELQGALALRVPLWEVCILKLPWLVGVLPGVGVHWPGGGGWAAPPRGVQAGRLQLGLIRGRGSKLLSRRGRRGPMQPVFYRSR